MAEQQIRFTTASDGVSICYATVGEGQPLVKAANWLSHLEFDWRSPVWRHWWQELSKDHKLVRYDQRGIGLSDWAVEDLSFDARVNDLEIVVDALGLDRFPLLGVSQGGPVAIAYAVRHSLRGAPSGEGQPPDSIWGLRQRSGPAGLFAIRCRRTGSLAHADAAGMGPGQSRLPPDLCHQVCARSHHRANGVAQRAATGVHLG